MLDFLHNRILICQNENTLYDSPNKDNREILNRKNFNKILQLLLEKIITQGKSGRQKNDIKLII